MHTVMLKHTLALLVGLFITKFCLGQSDIQHQQAIDLNDQVISSIRSIRVDVQHFTQEIVPGTQKPPLRLEYEFMWIKYGQEERLKMKYYREKTQKSIAIELSDTYNGSKGSKAIIGYDEANPPKITTVEPGSARGFIGPRLFQKDALVFNPRSILMLEIALGHRSYSLRELAKECLTVSMRKTIDENVGYYELTFKHDEADFVVWLDPKHNYAMKKIQVKPRNDPETISYTYIANSFRDLGNGLFLANDVVTEENLKGGIVKCHAICNISSLNEDIPQHEFQIKFPKGLVVVDNSTGQLHVWGDDKPSLSFATLNGYKDWLKQQTYKDRSSSRARKWLVYVAIGLVLIVLIMGAKRFRLQSKGQGQ